MNERLINAIDSIPESTNQTDSNVETPEAIESAENETTQEELTAYRIIQAIGAEIADPNCIAIRDSKS